MMSDVYFILLNLSFIMLVAITIYIARIKNKTQIHYSFLAAISGVLIWTFGYLGFFYWYYIFEYELSFFVKVIFTGIILTPLAVLFLGYIFAKTRMKFTYRWGLVFVVPITSLVIIYTNGQHQLFYKYFSAADTTNRIFGPWFTVHTIYSYLLILIGLWYLMYFIIKNSGFFSNQSKLVAVGILIPLIINMLITFGIGNLPYYFEAISFSFAIVCFAMAIFKFQFLNIVPIALQRIVDLISDSYVIINKDNEIIDFNRSFINTFSNEMKISRKNDFFALLEKHPEMEMDKARLQDSNKEVITSRSTIKYEDHVKGKKIDMYFNIELTPVFSGSSYLGTIILLKDITQSKRDLETIQKNNAVLMEQERLASLGQLIGGIAHNLRTPIMSISGGLEAITSLAQEYDESISDHEVTENDHHEIAAEIKEWVIKIKPFCSYMSDIISAVKDQAGSISDSSSNRFTLGELLKRVDILMTHELKKYHCKININSEVGMLTEFKGDASSLVQVFDNLIVNAIHSYSEKRGEIDIDIKELGGNVEFSFRDHGSGIPYDVQKKLFKEMLTTKGKYGTGLGLYMSYSTIRGRFNGDMHFESEPGKGSTFYVSIPCFRSE